MSKPVNKIEGKVFVDEYVNILTDEEAKNRIDERLRDELPQIDDTEGLARVSKERWQEAQRYERRTWLEQGCDLQSDRNDYHYQKFDGYAVLHGGEFPRAIELGCGPFTNMRIIMRECSVGDIVLLDPLIEQYLSHPYCQYRNRRLGGLKRLVGDKVKRKCQIPGVWPLMKIMATEGWEGKQVRLVPSMIEECPPVGRFELVVMINVIEHCQDADAVFRKILELSQPGTVFVLGDILYDPLTVRERMRRLYDVGHPLRVGPEYVERFLDEHFTRKYMRKEQVVREFCGVAADHQEIYFIGVRR